MEKARLAREAAERDRENREKRLSSRAVSQSLQDGLSGAAAAAATAAALMGTTGGKGAKSAESPPRNSTNEGRKSVDAESPMLSKKRRIVRPADQSSRLTSIGRVNPIIHRRQRPPRQRLPRRNRLLQLHRHRRYITIMFPLTSPFYIDLESAG
jgi:hypothetical protein